MIILPSFSPPSPNAAKPQRLKVTGIRYQVPDFPNLIFDIALSPWPLAFTRYHLSGNNVCAKNAVVVNKDSNGSFRDSSIPSNHMFTRAHDSPQIKWQFATSFLPREFSLLKSSSGHHFEKVTVPPDKTVDTMPVKPCRTLSYMETCGRGHCLK